MINFSELTKVVTSGKVVTAVILIDGKELFAMSFTLDTVAFKEILETIKPTEVKIPDKEPDKTKKAKSEKKDTPSKSKSEPEPLDDDEDDNDDTEDDPELLTPSGNKQVTISPNEDEVKKANDFIKKAEETKKAEPSKPLTREAILAQEEVVIEKKEEKKEEPKKEEQPNLFKDEW